MKKIKVLVIDDSALVRMLLTNILNQDPDIEVVGAAEDPYDAREKIKSLQPNVLTLDIEMPKMDGVTFLKNLMRLRPMPVVMISTLTAKGADITLQCLELGAIDYIAKPRGNIQESIGQFSEDIIKKVKTASLASTAHYSEKESSLSPVTSKVDAANSNVKVIAIGASTGGTEAIKHVVQQLPTNLPPIVITQHIPDVFSTSFAKRLDQCTPCTVIEVRRNTELKSGGIYLAPGDDHLLITRVGAKLFADIEHGKLVNRHRPSVSVMFKSVAESCGKNVVGIMLTGMGADGAIELSQLRDLGAYTIAQDEASCVVWGMPKVVVDLDGASEIVPLNNIAQKIVDHVAGK